MKTILVALLAICLPSLLFAQDPVSWNFTSRKLDDKTYELHFKANIQLPWHIYSQNLVGDGPVATTFSFQKHPLVTVDKTIKEVGQVVSKYEEVFSMNVKYYESEVDFIAIVRLKNPAKTAVTGTLKYMTCTDEKCLPPKTIPFSIKL